MELDATGCWLWIGAKQSRGYGSVGVGGKSMLAHRHIYELLVGPIPDGLTIDHLCRVRHCVNPEHLEPVTAVENVRRGREHYVPRAVCKNGHDVTGPNGRRPDGTCAECDRRRKRTAA